MCDSRTTWLIKNERDTNTKIIFFLGISGKSQILFAIVYLSRYLDLFTTFISAYNTIMKFIFISSSLGTLYLMYAKFRATYDHNHDSFRIEFLLVPCVILSLLINHDFTVLEVSSSEIWNEI
jgi:ER lumen protein retaining receptor